MEKDIQIKALITLAIMITACNLKQQRKDAIKAQKTSDSIMNEFNKLDQSLDSIKWERIDNDVSYEKKLDSFHQLLNSLNLPGR
jgi:hypothetical protein